MAIDLPARYEKHPALAVSGVLQVAREYQGTSSGCRARARHHSRPSAGSRWTGS
jgi:hypothetical protein